MDPFASCSTPKYPVGTILWKDFGGQYFRGEVDDYDAGVGWYHITYQDGDEEDLSVAELEPWVVQDGPPTKISNTTKKTSTSDLWTLTPVDMNQVAEKVVMLLPSKLRHAALNVAHMFLFVHERQSSWARRQSGEDPWSEFPVFRENFFCNNYRELDRGTCYFRAQVLQLDYSSCSRAEFLPQVLWKSYLYRQVNRLESFSRFGGIPSREEWPKFVTHMCNCQERGMSFFTAAHQTTSHSKLVRYVQETLKCKLLEKITPTLLGTDLQAIVKALGTLHGCGPFLSWQIACDLMESQCLTVDTESYCELGPGARNGLNALFGTSAKQFDQLDLLRLLTNIQEHVYGCLSLRFPKWDNRWLTLKNMEHVLCEYSKFVRICEGSDRKARTYRSRALVHAALLCHSCGKNDENEAFSCNTCLGAYCHDCSKAGPSAGSWICHECRDYECAMHPSKLV
jgi:hypothetical protein